MRFKDVFSIIGPAMIGPSSSHTAGAARIGRFARQLLEVHPMEASIILYGSFAATYQGHGTDVAIVGGMLDWQTDDPRLPQSLRIAAETGLAVRFEEGRGLFSHPNTVRLVLRTVYEDCSLELALTGASIGGGNIEITEIDGFSVKLSGMYPTLVIRHRDWTGVVANVTEVMRWSGTNIAHMTVDRKGRSGDALTALELDSPLPPGLINKLMQIQNVFSVHTVDLTSNPNEVAAISYNHSEETL